MDRTVASPSVESHRQIVSPLVYFPYGEAEIERGRNSVGDLYTQDKVWQEDPPVPVMLRKKMHEVMPISWIHTIAQRSYELDMVADYCVIVDEQVPGMEKLRRWLDRCDVMRPDGCILYVGTPNANDILPAILTETESSNRFQGSINKTAREVISQLRLLRTYSERIMQCQGFMFPSMEQASLVVLIDVQWQSLAFQVNLVFLKPTEVKTRVESAIQLMLDNRVKLVDSVHCNYFIRLSKADRHLLVHAESVQVPSKHSIILETADSFYKVPPTATECCNLQLMLELKDRANTDRESVVL